MYDAWYGGHLKEYACQFLRRICEHVEECSKKEWNDILQIIQMGTETEWKFHTILLFNFGAEK